jgi:hypothetical protein
MALVFQYGSNTDVERLNAYELLRGKAIAIGAAETVEPYRLVFDVWSGINKCAAADLVRDGERPAWGVLFEVPNELLTRATSGSAKSFDEIEAEGKNYRRSWLPVRDRDGNLLVALTYVVIRPQINIRTSRSYVRHILKGLQDHDVPPDYVSRVRALAIENNPDLSGELD